MVGERVLRQFQFVDYGEDRPEIVERRSSGHGPAKLASPVDQDDSMPVLDFLRTQRVGKFGFGIGDNWKWQRCRCHGCLHLIHWFVGDSDQPYAATTKFAFDFGELS